MNRIILISVLSILTLNVMAQEKIIQTAGRDQLGEFAPKFAELNDDILFGEVWSRNDLLNLRDRSLVTITSLISQGITDSSLGFHLQEAKKNGITRTEAAEIITHIAFYAGWPKAWAAFRLAKEVWAEDYDRQRCESSLPARNALSHRRTEHGICPIFHRQQLPRPYLIGTNFHSQRHLRTALPQQLAHPQSHERRRTDAHRHSRLRLVSKRRQTCRKNTARHGHPHPCKRKTLARRGS